MSELFGILNLNKPGGCTSRDVVNRVDRLVRPAKAGHAGTLDPLATGVLVVCVGPATRLIEYVQRSDKTYRATFLLGRSSPTDDVEGEITLLDHPPQPTRAEIEGAITPLLGSVDQRPPAFSALKVQGRRAYDLARRGEQVELTPRRVEIHTIDVISYTYPELVVDVRCGGGTYIRAIGRDLAESLGTAAVMSALVRTSIGEFKLADACKLEELTADTFSQHLRDPLSAVAALPRVTLTLAELVEIRHGRTIAREESFAEIAAVDETGHLAAIVVPRGSGRLGPSLNFSAALFPSPPP